MEITTLEMKKNRRKIDSKIKSPGYKYSKEEIISREESTNERTKKELLRKENLSKIQEILKSNSLEKGLTLIKISLLKIIINQKKIKL